ncbi:MAG TPA: ABC transporter substrate-binding protein [bacterium]|nr:ABC transporter substrate-binding protein [bacterium]
MRSWIAPTLAGLMVAGLIAAASAQGGRRGGTLTAAIDRDPPTMDPHRSGSAVDRQVYQNLYDKLVDTDARLAIVPMLATSWAISPDGKAVTFKLRPSVKFQDGTPFNADAVKYNFDRMKFDSTFPSNRRSELGPMAGVTVVDPSTVRIILEQPYSPLLYVLTDRAGMMVSPAAAQKEGLNYALHPVGTGPFSFVEKVPQDHITLQRNPDYWGKGLPYLERVVFREITDDNARVANLKSGDAQIINIVPAAQVQALAKEAAQPGSRFRLIEAGAMAWTALPLNTTKPPFDNKLLRQAFNATINREAIANVVLQKAVYPAYSFFPNGTPAYDPTWKLPPANVGLARAKLKEAGRPDGFEFTLLILPGGQRQAVGQAIQAMAAEAGIRVKLQVVEEGAIIDAISHLTHQAALSEWSGRPDPDFDIYPFTTKSGIGSFNYAGYVNPKLETALDAARYLSNMSQRRRAYGEATKILADDMPYVWLYFPKEYKLVSTRVGGFVDQPDGMMRFRSVWLGP